jgi:hypothetical protein
MALRICLIVTLLVCILAGVGWFTTRWNLEAAETKAVGENLNSEDGQGSGGEQGLSYPEEVSRLAEMANEQVMPTNQQIEQANASIAELTQKLEEAKQFGTYWWERAHPKEFESLDALKAWLAEDDSDSSLYFFGSACLPSSNYDCDDYATALMYNALCDGYLVSLQIDGNHMLNSTMIGNDIYFIEPQDDKVWLWGQRD